jgi:hypothetical protein
MNDTQLRLALGGAFLSRIKPAIGAVQSGSARDVSRGFNKQIAVRPQGCRLQPADLVQLEKAARIAVSEAIDSVSRQYGMTSEQLVGRLWPGPGPIAAKLSFTPPSGFGWSLDLDAR